MAETLAEEIARLEIEISQARSQRALVAQGKAVVEASRDGRRIRRQMSTLEELNRHIRVLESELYAAQVEAGITPARRQRRSAIEIGWGN